MAQGAPQHRFWPIVIAYGNEFEDVPKETATVDAASVVPAAEPVSVAQEEVIPMEQPVEEPAVAIDHMDESFTLAPVQEEIVPPAAEETLVVEEPVQEPEIIQESAPVQEEAVDIRVVWERAARNLALRPDLLAWLASLTPEMMAPKIPAPAPEVQEPEMTVQEAAVVVEQEPEVIMTTVVEEMQQEPIVQEVVEVVPEPSMFNQEPAEEIIEQEIVTEMIPPMEEVEVAPEEPMMEIVPEVVEEAIPEVVFEPEVITEQVMIESEIVTELPMMKEEPALVPQPVNSIQPEPTKKPETKKSFNKSKLNLFREEQNNKKGKTLLSGAPDVFLQNFGVNAFPSFSYSVRHVPSQTFWGGR